MDPLEREFGKIDSDRMKKTLSINEILDLSESERFFIERRCGPLFRIVGIGDEGIFRICGIRLGNFCMGYRNDVKTYDTEEARAVFENYWDLRHLTSTSLFVKRG